MTAWSQRAKTRLFAYLNGVETDITDYALVGNRGGIASFRGRQTLLSQMEPSTLQLVLNNVDGRFTPDNTSSPYYPYWGQGTRIRWTETIGPRTYTHFDGRLEIPQGSFNFMTSDASINDQIITLSAVDTLTWLGRQRPFVSTLAAHIVGSARNGALVGYWPLTGSTTRFAPLVPSAPVLISGIDRSLGASDGTQFGAIEPGSGAIIPGDDQAPVLLVPGLNAAGTPLELPFLSAEYASPPSFSAGQKLTAVLWINRPVGYPRPSTDVVLSFGTVSAGLRLRIVDSGSADYFGVDVFSTLSGSISSSAGLAEATARYYIVGVRYGFTPNTLELWVDDQTFTGTLTGSYVGADVFGGGAIWSLGSVAHLQFYLGADSDFTHDDFLAQRQVGLTGLDRQSTGERIRTVLGYAGVPTSAMDHIDPGSSLMSMAQLAGKTPLDAVQEANTTEQGRLFSRGDGLIAFHDRHRIYDV